MLEFVPYCYLLISVVSLITVMKIAGELIKEKIENNLSLLDIVIKFPYDFMLMISSFGLTITSALSINNGFGLPIVIMMTITSFSHALHENDKNGRTFFFWLDMSVVAFSAYVLASLLS